MSKKHPKHPILAALKAEYEKDLALAEAKYEEIRAKAEAFESKGECKLQELLDAAKAKVAELKAKIAELVEMAKEFGEEVKEDFELDVAERPPRCRHLQTRSARKGCRAESKSRKRLGSRRSFLQRRIVLQPPPGGLGEMSSHPTDFRRVQFE